MKTYKVTVTETVTKWYNESSELHREDGPAIEWANGDKFYYINGEELTKQEFKARDSKTVIT